MFSFKSLKLFIVVVSKFLSIILSSRSFFWIYFYWLIFPLVIADIFLLLCLSSHIYLDTGHMTITLLSVWVLLSLKSVVFFLDLLGGIAQSFKTFLNILLDVSRIAFSLGLL